ncbi:uncharacterized protein ISCGN_002721 [Ixodes scapularis]
MSYFAVERVIAKTRKGYLLKWTGYSKWNCTFEPRRNLTARCLASFETPSRPTDARLEAARDSFVLAIRQKLSNTKTSSGLVKVPFELDVFRWVFASKGESLGKGWSLYSHESDFERLNLPDGWREVFRKSGEGAQIALPIRMKPVLRFSRKLQGSDGEVLSYPHEKVHIYISTQARTRKSLDV